MYGEGRPGLGRQRRRRGGCDTGSRGAGLGRSTLGGAGGRVGKQTATRTFLALATTAMHDLRDPDGMTRPLLRRGALRLTTSARPPVQRLGAGYLRVDPPTAEEFARLAPPAPARAEVAATVEEAVLVEEADVIDEATAVEEADVIEGTATEDAGERPR